MNDIILYYTIKRIFCYLDEWGFYLVLLYCAKHKMWNTFKFVILFGSLAILTSYFNLDKIEKIISQTYNIEKQNMFYPFI